MEPVSRTSRKKKQKWNALADCTSYWSVGKKREKGPLNGGIPAKVGKSEKMVGRSRLKTGCRTALDVKQKGVKRAFSGSSCQCKSRLKNSYPRSDGSRERE